MKHNFKTSGQLNIQEKAKEMETRSDLRACCWARGDLWTDAREGCVGFTSSAKQLVTIWQSCQ